MKKGLRAPLSFVIFMAAAIALAGYTGSRYVYLEVERDGILIPQDTNDPDTNLPYPFGDESGGLYMDNPSNYSSDVEYDDETGQYVVTEKIGGLTSKPPMFMTPEEYREYVARKQVDDYWKSKTQSAAAAADEGRDPGSSLIPSIQVNSELFNKLFGSNTIDIRPQGYAELRFGGRIQKIDNPLIPERNRSTFTFDFDQRIQMNVTGNVGEKLKITTNYDTEATFSFENQMKVEFTGDEDDIIKKIELGNVSLPLNSSLISGAQSLFGVKGQFQFGKLMVTGVFSEQRSQSSSINVQGGATTTDFEISADNYDANRHFFLSHYFRENYEAFLANRPLITSPIQITKVEVWVTNTRQATEDNRNIVALMDLGERNGPGAYRGTANNVPGPNIFGRFYPDQGFPDNRNNALNPDVLENDVPGIRDISRATSALRSAGYEEAIEFVDLTNARKLTSGEFSYNAQLGYISLSSALNQDEILAVAFQFTAGGKTYQVGEFSTDGVAAPKPLMTKMLKSSILNVKLPIWDLMMKNIYSLNAYQVNQEDFRLDILYRNDETGTPIPLLPDGELSDELLLRATGLDKLNANNDPTPDGFFDFISNMTILPQSGKIIFPVLEPFGSNIARQLSDPDDREKYVFQQLYDSTRFKAQNEAQLNKYVLKGQYKSTSSSEISLNAFNIPQGSVVVTAGGRQLIENVDYTVDYNLGRVKIIDEGILQSGMPIKVDFENNAVFNFQTKTFMGVNADYKFNENLSLGATVVRLSEKPLTQKVNIGTEPIANTMWGLNGQFTKDAPYLTRAVDAIPFIDTKAPSNITVQGEFAQLVPGSPRGIEIDGEATTYLDDFESSQTTINIMAPQAWRLASTPAGQPGLFPEGASNGIENGFNRAKLAWYTIDPLFHRNSDGALPDHMKDDPNYQSGQFVRQVTVKEVFPNIQLDASQVNYVSVLDLAYYPDERGPYNYDVAPTAVSAGIDSDGKLNSPRDRWGGIMRDLSTTNFEEQNIEFVQFWVLNPFEGDEALGDSAWGDLYINLGNVSEDILRDGKQAVENGIPADGNVSQLDSSEWGYAPKVRPVVVAFDNDPTARALQDVGYDLISDNEEGNWQEGPYQPYLTRIINTLGQQSIAYTSAVPDPAADNFRYYRGNTLDQQRATILERYKNYNNPEANSDATEVDGVIAFATNTPDIEDVNRDQTMNKIEAYYQYKISMRKADLDKVGENYVTDIRVVPVEDQPVQPNGKKLNATWVQFKVPVFSPDRRVGPISDFRSIRFARMFMKGFESPVVLRFAKLELIRGEWRRYAYDLDGGGDRLNGDANDNTLFEVNAVSIEQNGDRQPVPYVVPPGIDRQIVFGTTSSQQANEQSLSLRVCDLKDGASRAVFKNLNFDMRNYNRLKMFAHAEDGKENELRPEALKDGDLTLFIRMGSDYEQNFYEYELPLTTTPLTPYTSDANLIWPEANNVDFALSDLKEVKLARDRAFRASNTSLTEKYSEVKGNATITVVGAPNLSNVRTIMIGVRNPKRRSVNSPDDGLSKCAEVWVNELRLSDFDQRGGWAANARVAAQLADFANVSVSGRTSSIGFGSIDQTVSERNKFQMFAYDLQSSFELGKFFPQDVGLRIPMYFGTGEEWLNPQFNPLDPDIEFQDALNNLETQAEKDELKEMSQDYTKRQSINFTNVRKDRVGNRAQAKPMPWDIENFSTTFSYSKIYQRNINVAFDERRDYRGSLNYTFRHNPKPVEPFKKVSWMKNDYLRIINDFNFYLLPKQFTVIGTLDRSMHEMQMRNTAYPDNPLFDLPTTYNNNFNFNRQYSLLYDLTKTLKVDFTANMRTRIDELVGIDTLTNQLYTREEQKAEIWKNLGDFGRPTNYHQTLNVNWQVPINKIAFLDWVNTQASYTGDYDWQANSLVSQNAGSSGNPDLDYGNTVQNNQRIQLNNNFNLISLYNNVPYLKKVNDGKAGAGRDARPRGPRLPGQGRGEDAANKKEEEETGLQKVMAGVARTLMMFRNASANYSRSEGILLPGFNATPSILGMDLDNNNAPGFWFTMGGQTNIKQDAVNNNWLTQSELLPTQYTETYSENMNFRLTAEPAKNFRIVFNAQRTESQSLSEFFRYNSVEDMFESQNTFITQNFTISHIMIGTVGDQFEDLTYDSETYSNFLEYRRVLAQKMAEQYAADNPGYQAVVNNVPEDSSAAGYKYFSYNAQDVLIPAFVSAYSGTDINDIEVNYAEMNHKKKIPLPNWQLTYDGLSNIKAVKKWFNSVIVTHGYRSTYTLGSISTNLLKQQNIQDQLDAGVPEDQLDPALNNNGDLMPDFQIGSVILSEQFSPLIGFNMKTVTNATLRVEYKKDRNIALGLTNAQITETKGQEWVIGAGYIIRGVKLGFISLGPRRRKPQSNLELKVDLGIRKNITLIRKIVEQTNQVSQGQRITTLKFSADYQISKRVQTKLFYDLNMSKYETSNAYPLTTHQFGISLRLNLGA